MRYIAPLRLTAERQDPSWCLRSGGGTQTSAGRLSGSAGYSLERRDPSGCPWPNRARGRDDHQFAHCVRRLAVARRAPGQEQRALLPRFHLVRIGGFIWLIRHRKGLPAVQADDSPECLGLQLLLHDSPRCGEPLSHREGSAPQGFADCSVAANRFGRFRRLPSLHHGGAGRSVKIL
jgi:hypothetical protein